MTDETQQPVVNTPDAAAPPAQQGQDARTDGDELERLLSEYERTAPQPAPVPPPAPAAPAPDYAAINARMDNFESNVLYKQDMVETVKEIRGDLDPEVFTDRLIESWLDGEARVNPKLAQAWFQRQADPSKFKKIKAELGKSLNRQFSKLVDKQATEDRNAVTQAVRGASTRAPVEPPPSFAGKSNAEFRKEVMEKYGFDPGV